jgi:hypothetical protein
MNDVRACATVLAAVACANIFPDRDEGFEDEGIIGISSPVRSSVSTAAVVWSTKVAQIRRDGAEGGTRTRMGCPTRPSNVRVYQFHHFGAAEAFNRSRIIEVAQKSCQRTRLCLESRAENAT